MSHRLNEPLKFKCGVGTKNRVALAPLTNSQSPGGCLSEDEYQWLAARIRGGFGIVTSCATHVMKTAQGWDGELGIFADEQIPGWQRLASLGTAEGALVIPQLFHGGFRCPSRLTGLQPVSASVFELDTPDFETPRALREDEILEIKEAFVMAARRAIQAGLPGVEIHGANGYLFTQFLSPMTNRREDRWGGTLENRARFLIEVTREVRKAIGADNVLGVRISPESTKLISMIDIDEMKDVANELCQIGADYISLSLWDARKPSDKYGSSHSAPTVIEQFRKVLLSSTAVTASGKIWTREEAEAVLDLGADIVVLGGAGIANPNWPVLIEREPQNLKRFPLTRAELRERAVSDRFIDYLERWSFVAKS